MSNIETNDEQAEINVLRAQISLLLQPLWQNDLVERERVYAVVSSAINREYHPDEIRSVSDAKEVLSIARFLRATNFIF